MKKDVPIQIKTIGNVEAYHSVTIKSRIEGQLLVANIKEGDEIKKGQLLFIIDPRPYEETVRQAEANLLRDKAQLDFAKADLERYEELFKEQLVSKQQFEKIRTNYESLKSVVKADEAILKNARLNLNYCYIHSPIDGKIGALFVHPGNMIKANETQIATINQIMPIYVRFSLPEQELLRVKKAMTQNNLKTEVIIKAVDTNYTATGRVVFIDNAIDPSTGTIKLKAEFDNKNKLLWPGQFVNVVLTLDIKKDAVVIPYRALQTGQQGQYVFVITKDNTAEMREVNVGIRFGDDVVIEKGLNVDEIVVVDGQLRLTPGAKVEIKNK
ncbi:MAG: efflux RND transporter periplasmic adaptor subunit [Thermodesulfovibrio sp.]|nr:efflux RND transporter periplasmic adaptor subunit [Thermodesulfovibrio sp.]